METDSQVWEQTSGYQREERWKERQYKGMGLRSESEVTQSCPTLRDPMHCSPPGSSVHGISQARVLEWGTIAFSEKQSTDVKLSKWDGKPLSSNSQ